jgi:hypothetical protein
MIANAATVLIDLEVKPNRVVLFSDERASAGRVRISDQFHSLLKIIPELASGVLPFPTLSPPASIKSVNCRGLF